MERVKRAPRRKHSADLRSQVLAECAQPSAAPKKMLVDGGFPAHEQIDAAADNTEVYAPVPEPRAKRSAQGEEAKAPYKQRAATAECVNAQA